MFFAVRRAWPAFQMERCICIHGHFYQPPRENPWLEAVERQDSAYPYHDWNERITAECYAPNAASRILDDAGPHRRDRQQLRAHQLQLRPDAALLAGRQGARNVRRPFSTPTRDSQERFSGHGSAHRAGVQPHDHAAGQPRATSARRCIWGIRDFEYRFGRDAGRHVAAGDRGRHRNARGPGRARDPLHDPRAASGATRAQDRRHGAGTMSSGARSIRPRLRCQAALGTQHRPVLLRRAHLARRRLRGAARQRREFRRSPDGRLLRRRATGRSSSTLPPTARPTATTIATATWRWPTRCDHIERTNLARASPTTASSWRCIRRRMKSRSSRTPPGAARTASSAGAATAAATPARAGWNQQWRAPLREALDWLRDSARRAVRDARPASCCTIRGRRATTTSTSCSTARRSHVGRFLRSTPAAS